MKLLKLSCAVAAALSVAPAVAQENAQDEVMVVTATTNQVSIEQAPASVSVITSEEISKIPATDITKALGKIAGLQLDSRGGDEPSIKIRGLDSDYTLILVNGRKVNSKDAIVRGAFDMSSIPMSAIDRVEVVRGPMSTLYGSEAIGGVVNIILKQPTDETFFAGSLAFSKPQKDGGELASYNLFASGSVIPDKLLFNTSIDVSDRKVWQASDERTATSAVQEGQERTSFDTTLTWLATEKDTVLFDLGYVKDDRVAPWPGSGTSYYESQRSDVGAGYERVSDWGVSNLNYYFEKAEIIEDNAHPALPDVMTGTQTNHNVDGKTVLALGSHTLTAGFDFSHTEITHTKFYTDSEKNHQAAVYLQDEFAINDELTLTASGRYTKHNEFGSHFSPRAYLVYSATENLTIKGGYGEGFKAPAIWRSSDKFFMISCRGSCYLTGNPDLKPETSKSLELTAVYTQPTWFVQGTVYQTKLKDMIDRDMDSNKGTSPDGKKIITNINRNEVETKGFEIEGEIDLSETVYLTTNATYTDSKDTKADEELTFTPKWAANAGLNWATSDELSLFTDVKYTGKQLNWSREDLAGFTTVDLGGRYQVSGNFAVKAGITNLTDYRFDEQDVDYGYVDTGRTFYAAVDFEF